ncbi:MAG: hypothetical protein WCJ19_03070 [bacterium]
MATPQFELYHGIVLAQIIRNPKINIKLLERNNEFGWGAYEVSDNLITYRVFVKSSSQIRKTRKAGFSSAFTFSESDILRLRSLDINKHLLICLVCADQEVCTLESEDIDNSRLLMEKTSTNIIVYWSSNSRLHIKCRSEKLKYTIPRNKLINFNWI